MFQRFQQLREEREGGFTLIELLVVILIIAILAAIAIPVFLNQRKKGWVAQAQSALKNMATAEETYLVETGSYQGNGAAELTNLSAQGFRYSTSEVTPDVISANAALDYCLKATSAHDTSIVWYYDSDVGAPTTAVCS